MIEILWSFMSLLSSALDDLLESVLQLRVDIEKMLEGLDRPFFSRESGRGRPREFRAQSSLDSGGTSSDLTKDGFLALARLTRALTVVLFEDFIVFSFS